MGRPGRTQLRVPQQPRVPGQFRVEKNDTRFQKTLGMNDYYFGDDDFEYPKGNVQMVGKSSGATCTGVRSLSRRGWHRRLRSARWPSTWWTSASTEDLPRPDNRVTLAEDGNNIVPSYTLSNREPMEQLTTG